MDSKKLDRAYKCLSPTLLYCRLGLIINIKCLDKIYFVCVYVKYMFRFALYARKQCMYVNREKYSNNVHMCINVCRYVIYASSIIIVNRLQYHQGRH